MSKRIFFIVPYPFGEAPSQRFRFEQYIPYLKENGYEIEIHPFYDYKTWQTLYSEGNILKKAWGVFSSFMRRFALLFKLRIMVINFLRKFVWLVIVICVYCADICIMKV